MLTEPNYIAGTTGRFWHAAESDRYSNGVAHSLCGREVFVDHHADGSPVTATNDDRENLADTGAQFVECLSCIRIIERNRRAVEAAERVERDIEQTEAVLARVHKLDRNMR